MQVAAKNETGVHCRIQIQVVSRETKEICDARILMPFKLITVAKSD
jgi:hypothetical protein